MRIPRELEPRLLRSAKTRPVVVLTGARQTGKTSTFLRLFPKHAFVSLDLPAEAEQAEMGIDSQLEVPKQAGCVLDLIIKRPAADDAGRKVTGSFCFVSGASTHLIAGTTTGSSPVRTTVARPRIRIKSFSDVTFAL